MIWVVPPGVIRYRISDTDEHLKLAVTTPPSKAPPSIQRDTQDIWSVQHAVCVSVSEHRHVEHYRPHVDVEWAVTTASLPIAVRNLRPCLYTTSGRHRCVCVIFIRHSMEMSAGGGLS